MKSEFNFFGVRLMFFLLLFCMLNAQLLAMEIKNAEADEISKLNNLSAQIIAIDELLGGRQWYSAKLTDNRLLMVRKYTRGFGLRYPTYSGTLEINRFAPKPKIISLPPEKSIEYFDVLAAEYQKQKLNKSK